MLTKPLVFQVYKNGRHIVWLIFSYDVLVVNTVNQSNIRNKTTSCRINKKKIHQVVASANQVVAMGSQVINMDNQVINMGNQVVALGNQKIALANQVVALGSQAIDISNQAVPIQVAAMGSQITIRAWSENKHDQNQWKVILILMLAVRLNLQIKNSKLFN